MEGKTKSTELKLVNIEQEQFFQISNSDLLRPFFMSIVSDSDHWMFISSNGGLSAGRKNAENALFPYYTDDKITESADITGSKTILQVHKNGQSYIWEPFSNRYEGQFKISRNLYKNIYGNTVIFEEENHDLQLCFRYQWSSSNEYGFVKQSKIINKANQEVKVSILDGIQNILPYGVNSALQNQSSNLVDAYKKCELEQDIGLGIYSLSAIIVDKAEPSEALKANIVWSSGLNQPKYLLSSLQLSQFRKGFSIQEEQEIKAEKGAYFTHQELLLGAESGKEWMTIAGLNQNHAGVAKVTKALESKEELAQLVKKDIEKGTRQLIELNAAADGLQLTSDNLRDTRHFSNTLFNIMRGGIFDDNYNIEKEDFSTYLFNANKQVSATFSSEIAQLPELFSLAQLKDLASQIENPNFKRLCIEYLPLKFSRRHGDPSRPWNKFSINTRSEVDGSKILDYEGNWRDIFQNWEALAHSYPDFMENMIHKFLNATTFDGYNPYRVTKGGFDWETIEPDDPWSYIGYWGDHQIIYLLKFLEFIEHHAPGKLEKYYNQDIFVYANVPYKIKPYQDILNNSKDTIDFDNDLEVLVRADMEKMGADGALIKAKNQDIYQVNFIEKILSTVLAKLSNFILEGGIWMNTQRPEWNDANNALVGNGVSVVTLCYLRRFQNFFKDLLDKTKMEEVAVSKELVSLFQNMLETLTRHQSLLSGKVNDKDRKTVLDFLGKASEDYRTQIYQKGFKGDKTKLSLEDLKQFTALSLQYIDHSIEANKRKDHLFHAYNLMSVNDAESVTVTYLSEMLEGQVAVLSSGYLSSVAALEVLDSLKKSALFRADQYSYILYPNKTLPRFIEKNNIPKEEIAQSELLTQLLKDGNIQIVEQDVSGKYHFNGNFKNANDLRDALDKISSEKYADSLQNEKHKILGIFEKVFNHKEFTGRSGTFYGYEGLGSIYWHMVSKLLYSVQECCLKAINEGTSDEVIGRLLEHYYEINAGIGVHKSPSLYGAFPTDPYSHTPAGKGAQQPGMTGQVKEDILCRFGELGVIIKNGHLGFKPSLLRKNEFLTAPKEFHYINVHAEQKSLALAADSLCFTYCQVPIVYQISSENRLEIIQKNQSPITSTELILSTNISRKIFGRTGEVERVIVSVKPSDLR